MSHFGVARDLRAALAQKEDTTTLITPSISSFPYRQLQRGNQNRCLRY
jgi:hypothetical protein